MQKIWLVHNPKIIDLFPLHTVQSQFHFNIAKNQTILCLARLIDTPRRIHGVYME
jgi:hypothetical protein